MKPPKGKVPGAPTEWICHAESDLRLAVLAAGDKKVLREQACFHAQQSAEKAIKAVLLARGAPFPLVHDIEELLDIADQAGISIPNPVHDAGLLTPYAVETRSPAPGPKSPKPTSPRPFASPNLPWNGRVPL